MQLPQGDLVSQGLFILELVIVFAFLIVLFSWGVGNIIIFIYTAIKDGKDRDDEQ